MASERIQKVLARVGIGSRRAVERMLVEGRVVVNGLLVTRLGTAVDPARDHVEVDGRRVRLARRRAPVVLALHKPRSVLTTLSDPAGRATVGELVQACGRRVFPVGRLDWDADGLVLLTDDGELAHRLTHPRHHVPRTYQVKVRGDVGSALLERLLEGLELEDGLARASRARIVGFAARNTWVELVVHEGRTHLVKRMIRAAGGEVTRLRRVAYGGVHLGDLPRGAFRRLAADEIRALEALVADEGQDERVLAAESARRRSLRDLRGTPERPKPRERRHRPGRAPAAGRRRRGVRGAAGSKPASGRAGARRPPVPSPRARRRKRRP